MPATNRSNRPEYEGRRRHRQCQEMSLYFERTSLAELLWNEITLSEEESLDIARSVCNKVIDMHEKSIILGELAPTRITILSRQELELTVDCGPGAKESKVGDTVSESSRVFAPRHYLSPEVLLRQRPTKSSDVFSIGCLLYSMLEGIPLKTSQTRQKSAEDQHPQSLREKLNRIIARATNPVPMLRYQKVEELLEDLTCAQQGRALQFAVSKLPLDSGKAARKLYEKMSSKRVLPLSRLTTCILALVTLFVVLSPTIGRAETDGAPQMETLWNKPAHKYKYGDRFSITIVPRKKAYVYLFYVDEEDHVTNIYPSCHQESNIVTPEEPLKIETIANYALRVDSSKGKIVAVSVKDSERSEKFRQQLQVIRGEGRKQAQMSLDGLKISGNSLINNLSKLSESNPKDICFNVEDAPRSPADQTSHSRTKRN